MGWRKGFVERFLLKKLLLRNLDSGLDHQTPQGYLELPDAYKDCDSIHQSAVMNDKYNEIN
jgi:hypothetical protein